MGTVFAIFTAIFVFIVALATRHYMQDTRGRIAETGKGIKMFFCNSLEVVADRHLRLIISFCCIGSVSAIFVATLQMYLYVYYMHLTALQKTLTHGGGMVLCGLGAIYAAPLARKLDKKYAVCIGAAIAAGANLLAGTLFLGGILQPTTVWLLGGFTVPIAVVVFAACNMFNWFGIGIFSVISGSMIADVAEVNELKSGVRKDGGYAAISAFMTKLVASLATFIASVCLAWVGFVSGSDNQTPEAIRRLVWLTFGLGSLFAALVIPIALRYSISHAFIVDVKEALARKKEQTAVS
jgi:Na+/melibiose symporter-like transporter